MTAQAGPRAAPRVVMFDTLSGTNDYAVELVRALGRLGPLTVVTVDSSKLRPGDCSRLLPVIPAFAAPQPRAWKALRMAWAYAVLVAQCLRAPTRTVLHIQFLRFEKLEARLFGGLQRLGVTLVYSAHNALPHDQAPWHADFYRRWYARVDVVHTLSRSVLQDMVDKLGVQPRRSVLIGHGPYQGLQQRFGGLDPLALRRQWGIAPGRFVILQYGLFKEYKGLHHLVQALCALPQDVRPLLVLAGAGPVAYLDGLQRQVDAAGRGDCLLWQRRFVDDEELCGLIRLADLVVFPYTKVSQSGALYLSMTFGKPCLCNDLPGFREMLPLGDDFFVATGQVPALAGRLRALADDPAALQRMGDVVRGMAAADFNWDTIARQTWQMYAGGTRQADIV